MADRVRFQPFEILRTLAEHDVAYVLIGGLAATFYGAQIRTGDADVCPMYERENLARLAAALQSMNAGLRVEGEPEPIKFSCDEHFLAQMEIVNLRTRYGPLDISMRPAGTSGYAELIEQAEAMELRGIRVVVASLSDVIRSKATANRPKDQLTLPALYALQDEIEKRREG